MTSRGGTRCTTAYTATTSTTTSATQDASTVLESGSLPLVQSIYVPRDELFGHLNMQDLLGYTIKALVNGIVSAIRTYVDISSKDFDSFKDILKLYEGGLKLPSIPTLEEVRERFPIHLIKDLIPASSDYIMKIPKPHAIRGFSRWLWC